VCCRTRCLPLAHEHSEHRWADRQQAEALFNLANNGVLTRVDERGRRCEDLYQWGLHPHTAETGSALAADDDAFAATYP